MDITDWWGIRYFVNVANKRKRWKYLTERTRNAVCINDVLKLAEYKGDSPHRFVTALSETWPKIPLDVRDFLCDHWRKLQRSWDDRQPRLAMTFPIVCVNVDPIVLSTERGTLLGALLIARKWNGYAENYFHVEARFASSHLVWYDDFDNAPAEVAPVAVALNLANYYLRIRQRADSVEFITEMADGADELATQWGFDVDGYYKASQAAIRS